MSPTPVLPYSTYIPQQHDIENNINNIKTDIDKKMNHFGERLDKYEDAIAELKEINKKIGGELCCTYIITAITIVLFTVIYLKVYVLR